MLTVEYIDCDGAIHYIPATRIRSIPYDEDKEGRQLGIPADPKAIRFKDEETGYETEIVAGTVRILNEAGVIIDSWHFFCNS